MSNANNQVQINLFERAARKKFRFMTAKGYLSVEELWDLPLQTRNGIDLDNVARAVNVALKNVSEESFVDTRINPHKKELEYKLELVKYIIAVKIEEEKKATERAARLEERKKLIDILADKNNEELKSMSKEQIAQRLAALSADNDE